MDSRVHLCTLNNDLKRFFFRSFDGEQLNGERLRLGFARPAPSKCVWCCGLPTKRDLSASVGSDVVVKAVQGEFGRFGKIQDVLYDEERGHALVYYDQVRQIGKLFELFFTRVFPGIHLCTNGYTSGP